MFRRASLSLCLGASLLASGQKVGIVLSGGGAVGLTHIGVLQALEENGIPVDYIAGSSMGALVGAMYAAGYSPWEIDSLFSSDVYRVMAEGGVEDQYTYYFKQDAPDATAIDVRFDLDTTWQALLPTNLRSPVLIDFEQMRGFAGASAASGYDMDSLFVPYRCVASDITDQRPVVFRSGDLAQAVRASMSYPFYFKPISVDGHIMMDGGLYNNFPSDVMYNDFLPDVMIGSNVAYNAPPPTEDDLVSQLKAMLQEKTNYAVPCEVADGIIIEPKTETTLFDFSNNAGTVHDGYVSAMARMPEILKTVQRRVDPNELARRRAAFRAKYPPLRIGEIQVDGLKGGASIFAERTLVRKSEPITTDELKPHYFRLYADNNVALLYPRLHYDRERGNYDLNVTVKRERRLEARFGGLISSRPISTGMIGLRYNFFGRSSNRVEAFGYFGKFYSAVIAKVRMDFSTALPFYVEPVFTLHRWDYFSSFATFFAESKPAYIVQQELWTGINTGTALGNKGIARFDIKYAQTKDSYYQTTEFTNLDTADVTEFFHLNTGIMVERNSLNRKQHPNAGESLKAEVRYITGTESTTPGSTWPGGPPQDGNTGTYPAIEAEHEWFQAKVTLDKYFLPRGHFKFGVLGEGLYSGQPYFQNYTATIARSPAFQPTPESRTYFMDQFRSTKYLAFGLRTIIAVAKNKLDLRFEGYVFQPYKAIRRGEVNEVLEGEAFSDRYYIGSGSLIYQSPIGPIWFNTSYLDGLEKPWQFSLNFGYVIFGQKAGE